MTSRGAFVTQDWCRRHRLTTRLVRAGAGRLSRHLRVLALVLLMHSLVGQAVAQHISRLFALTDTEPFITYSWGEHWQILRGGLRGFEGPIRAMACVGPQVFAGGSHGMFESTDFGETFRELSKWTHGEVTVIVAARMFALEPTLMVGTTGGLYRTDDGGVNYEALGSVGRVHAIAWPGPEMFIAGSEGLYLSTDKADTVERLADGLPSAPVLSLALSSFFSLDPVLFVGTDGHGLFRSDDGGKRFERVGPESFWLSKVNALAWWNEVLLVGADDGLYVSVDLGEHMESVPFSGGSPDLEVRAISIPAAGAGLSAEIFVGTTEGVFKSSDGGSNFRAVEEGLTDRGVNGFASFAFPEQTPTRR